MPQRAAAPGGGGASQHQQGEPGDREQHPSAKIRPMLLEPVKASGPEPVVTLAPAGVMAPFTNVQTTLSPAANVTVACPVAITVEPVPPPVQLMLLSA